MKKNQEFKKYVELATNLPVRAKHVESNDNSNDYYFVARKYSENSASIVSIVHCSKEKFNELFSEVK